MTLVRDDRICESTTTTGTGALTLAGAVPGCKPFSSVCTVGDTFYGVIEAVDANGVPTGAWEDGLYTYSAPNTITRTAFHKSSNANSPVNFAAGTKRVSIQMTSAALRALTGGVPASAPYVVQIAQSIGNVAAVFPVAPTSGNLLLALCTSSNGDTAQAGWTKLYQGANRNDEVLRSYSKTAGAGESTSQTPATGLSTITMVIFEIANASGAPILATSGDEFYTCSGETASPATAPAGLQVGIFSSWNSNQLPVVTGGAVDGTSTGTSGTARGLTAFHNPNSAGNVVAAWNPAVPGGFAFSYSIPGIAAVDVSNGKAAPTLVQKATLRNNGTIALPVAPTVGNTMILLTAGWAQNMAGYVPAGFTQITNYQNTSNDGVFCWVRDVQAGDTGSYAITATDNHSAVLYEYSGVGAIGAVIGGAMDSFFSGTNFSLTIPYPAYAGNDVMLAVMENDTAAYWSANAATGLIVDYTVPNDTLNHTGMFVRYTKDSGKKLTGSLTAAASSSVYGVFYITGKYL